MRLALDLLTQRRSIGLPPEDARMDMDLLSTESVVDALVKRSLAVGGDENLRELNAPFLVQHGLAPVYVARQMDVGDARRTIVRFVVTSGEDARDDKDLDLLGVDWTGYDVNPVWMRSHQWDEPPLGRVLQRQIYKRGGTYELWKDVEFTPEDIYPLGAMYGRMHADGWMRACSGSWLGKKIRVVRGKGGAPQRVQYLASDWMETSSCSVPIDKFSVQQQVERGLISPQIAERIQTESRAYCVQGDPMKKRKEAGKLAFKAGEARTLIEGKTLENPFEEEYAAASRAMDAATRGVAARACPSCGAANEGQNVNCRECGAAMGDVPEETPPAAPAEEPAAAPESTPPAEGDADPAAGDGGEGDAGAVPGEANPGAGDEATGDDAVGGGEQRSAGAGSKVVVRGPVMDALDPAVDQLTSSIVILANVADELRSLCVRGFYENRAAMTPVQLETVLREQFERVLPDIVERYVDLGAPMMGGNGLDPEFGDYLERQVHRGEAALAGCGNALSEVRDAVALYGEGVAVPGAGELVSQAASAGSKGTDAWKKRVESAMALAEQTLSNLRTVVEEGPPEAEAAPKEPPPAAEDPEDGADGPKLSDAEQMAEDLKQKKRAMDERLALALAKRDQPVIGEVVSARERLEGVLAQRAPVIDSATPEAVIPLDPEVVTSLSAKLDEALAKRAAAAPPAEPAASEPEPEAPRRTQRSVRAYPGIRLPARVAERLGLPTAR